MNEEKENLTDNKNEKPDTEEVQENVSQEDLIKKLTEEKEKYYNNWLRAEAELDNFKKRVLKEKEEFRKFALEGLIKEILTPVDYLEMAIEHTKNAENMSALIQGVEYTIKSILDILKSYGVEQVKGVDKFDPNFFEASDVEEREDVEEGTILKVHRKAYTIQGRLLRAGIVSVAKKPEKTEKESENIDKKEE
ncbi:MAG: nucleotide exchange factor GrpE [Proteobacteria bacterium]|nr:nucleotide exchange factor GrpE [Pseudomonadota bacterium]